MAVSSAPASPGDVPGVSLPAWQKGQVLTVHSPDEFKQRLNDFDGEVAVLMCKAMACRPCKAFTRKYARMAQEFDKVQLLPTSIFTVAAACCQFCVNW
jgi:hypothetical protein